MKYKLDVQKPNVTQVSFAPTLLYNPTNETANKNKIKKTLRYKHRCVVYMNTSVLGHRVDILIIIICYYVLKIAFTCFIPNLFFNPVT